MHAVQVTYNERKVNQYDKKELYSLIPDVPYFG
jgi:hypothetical protein